jgi:deoxycytidylate deaminase
MSSLKVTQLGGPELVFGLVGAVGTDLDRLTATIEEALASVNYRCHLIRLSSLMHEFKKWSGLRNIRSEEARIERHMDAGNEFREKINSGDALAIAAIGSIKKYRSENSISKEPLERQAFLLRSLKHPQEVNTLRRVYGKGFVLVAGYSPRDIRLNNLTGRLADFAHSSRHSDFRSSAERIVNRDEREEGKQFGQDVRGTFPLADVFVDVSDPVGCQKSVTRFVEVFFSYPFHTPTREEYAMFLAQAAALRSAALARQVGAVIATADGDVVAVGTNEVPKPGGGQYWYGDVPDSRDFRLGHETSDKMKKILLADIVKRLQNASWLSNERSSADIDSLVDELTGRGGILRDSQVMDLIEFARPMHAEMAALLDGVRRGVSTNGGVLYSTTFPCHDCARHIVASGIKHIFYVHPYPKSHTAELYPDAMRVDETTVPPQISCTTFIGIAPIRYMDLFTKVDRKDETGKVVIWHRAEAQPRFAPPDPAYMASEDEELRELTEKLTKAGVEPVEAEG